MWLRLRPKLGAVGIGSVHPRVGAIGNGDSPAGDKGLGTKLIGGCQSQAAIGPGVGFCLLDLKTVCGVASALVEV